MTDRYAVIGNPIEQSKSPLIHTAFAQVTGQDIDYTKVLSPLGAFAQTVDAFRAAGGRGMNVTAPFKLDAFAYATDLAPSMPAPEPVVPCKISTASFLGSPSVV